MTVSVSRFAYQDCYEIMDKALDDPQGLRLHTKSNDDATFIRMRMHMARKLDREHNKEIYPPEDPKYGVSPYDQLILRIRQHAGEVWLYIERITVESLGEVELLSEAEALPAPEPRKVIEHEPPLQITQIRRRV